MIEFFFSLFSFSIYSCNHQTENELASEKYSNYIDKKFDFLYENFENFDDLKIEQVRKFLEFFNTFWSINFPLFSQFAAFLTFVQGVAWKKGSSNEEKWKKRRFNEW